MKPPSREQCLEWSREHGWARTKIQQEALILRAYKEGAEAMREEAAKVCKEGETEYRTNMRATTVGAPYVVRAKSAKECVEAIRNLKVEE